LDDSETQRGPLLSVHLALIELRRRCLRFLDFRGAIAEDLLEAYENVTLHSSVAGNPVAAVERLQIVHGETARSGAIDSNRVTYSDEDPRHIEEFLSEAPVFLRKAEHRLSPEVYSRVGIRFAFSVPGEPTVEALAQKHFRTQPRLSLSATDFRVRAEGLIEGWGVIVTVRPIKDDSLESNYIGRLLLDIDQFKNNVKARDALRPDLAGAFTRAKSVASEFAEDWTHE
jgi:hypothetical protein